MKRNGIGEADQKEIREAAASLRSDGYPAQDAAVTAVKDRLDSLIQKREDVMDQVGKAQPKPTPRVSKNKAQEETQAFQTWFGDSVTTMNGAPGGVPLVLYHGTRAYDDFDVFNTYKGEMGSHFGTQAQAAQFVPGSNAENLAMGIQSAMTQSGVQRSRVMPVYVKLENPLRLNDEGNFDNETVVSQLIDLGIVEDSRWDELVNAHNQDGIKAAIKGAGYDGIVYLNRREGVDLREDDGFSAVNEYTDKAFKRRYPAAADSYIIFDPRQVKSATGNNGEFSPREPNFSKHRVPSPNGAWNTWVAPDITSPKWEAVVFNLQDKHLDTKKIIAAIESSRGVALPEAQNAYLQEELYHGRAGKLSDDFMQRELKPLIQDLALRKVSLDDLETYLHNRHAEERNIQIAKINPQMPDAGSGIKTADARAYLAGLPSAKRAAYVALARRVDAIIARTNQMLVSEGLESQKTIDAWNGAYKNYVPLHREDVDSDSLSGTGQGYTVKGSASKRATGSTKPVENIVANLAIAREKTITRGGKNRVATALVNLALSNHNPSFWSVDNPEMIKYVGPSGIVISTIDPMWKSRDNVVVARMPDGKGGVVEHAVVFNKHNARAVRMASSMKNLTAPELGVVIGAAAKVTRYFAAINTQYNPIFGVVNIVRDTQQLFFNLTTTAIAGKQLAVLRGILPALVGTLRDLRSDRKGRPARSGWAQTYEEFQNAGGATGYRDMFVTPEDRTKAIEREIKHAGRGKVRAVPREFIKWAGGWLSDYNTAMENATRLSAYKVARDNGVSVNKAASIAKNLTVNFNRKGNVSSQIGSLYAFFNASAQGTARLYETIRGPKGAVIVAGGVLAGVLQAFALAAAGFDDDEPPEFVRERSFIIPIGGKKYVTIPMPLGLNFLPNVGRVGAELALTGGKDATSKTLNLLGLMFDTFSPVGGGSSPAQVVAPTLFDPAVALLENKDWTGKQIARPDMNPLNPSPGHERASEKASPWARWMSEAINVMSGGTEFTPGRLSPTPDAIDYVAGQIGGGVAREVAKVGATISAAGTGEELPAHKIPLVGRFYGNADGQTKEGAAFYRNVIEINKHERELKGREANDGDVEGYYQDNPVAELVKEGAQAEREVSKLRKERRQLVKDGAPPSEVKAIEAEITDAMRDLNELVKEARRP
jgi:hypothetical protein